MSKRKAKKTIIHVNQNVIRSNLKHGRSEPVITVKTFDSNKYGHEAILYDENGKEVGRVIYRPNKPLSCGARVWIMAHNKVKVIRHMSVKEDVLDVVRSVFGNEEASLNENTSFTRDLAADDLDKVELMLALEDKFSITIPDGEDDGIATIGDAIEYCKKATGREIESVPRRP